MILSSRKKRGPDRYLDWRVRLFFVGAVLALLGISLGSSILVGLAIAVLLLGLGFRFLPSGDGGVEADENNEERDSTTRDTYSGG